MSQKKDIVIRTIVFPRNQWRDEYVSVLSEHGITSYRGSENSWIYRETSSSRTKAVRRFLRLMDSYFNITGSNTYSLGSIAVEKPFNIPSSRFLRPISKRYAIFEFLRKRRIIRALQQAAEKQEIFHLWWHPHNFGSNIDENIAFLDEILSFFRYMKMRHGMKSLNMGEIGKLVSKGDEL